MMMRPSIIPLKSDSIGRLVIKAIMKTSKVGRTDTKPGSLIHLHFRKGLVEP